MDEEEFFDPELAGREDENEFCGVCGLLLDDGYCHECDEGDEGGF